MIEYISVGEFVKPHGLSGDLLLIPYNPNSEVFNSRVSLFIYKNSFYEGLKFDKIRQVNKGFLIKLSNVNSIDDALVYKKMPVFVKKTDVNLDEDEHLIANLINLKCYNQELENIGTVTQIYQGETDVMEVKSSGVTFLIPMTTENIIQIDYAKNIVVVKNEENYKI